MAGRIDIGADEYRPLPVCVSITPKNLNLQSNGNWITCSISLQGDYNAEDVYWCIFVDGTEIEAESVQSNQSGHITAKFNRVDVNDLLEPGEVELTVYCQTSDGTWFSGSDMITVTDKGNNK